MLLQNICYANNSFKNRVRTTSFGSINCPVKTFTLDAKPEPLTVRELNEQDCQKATEYLFKFGMEFFNWDRELKTAEEREKRIAQIYTNIVKRIKKQDPNNTLLMAEQQSGAMKAFFSIGTFDILKSVNSGFYDTKIGHIGTCFLDEEYRNRGVGNTILDKLLQTANGHFTDILLEARLKAVPFYLRAGFLPLDISIPMINKIRISILESFEHTERLLVMSKSIDPQNPWWQRAAKQIKR